VVIGEVAVATRQCQEWEKTLDAVQETRAQEREDCQSTLAHKVRLTSLCKEQLTGMLAPGYY